MSIIKQFLAHRGSPSQRAYYQAELARWKQRGRPVDDSPTVSDPSCPFCGRQNDNCEHLLLIVDRTFRTAEGGILMEAFNDRWSALCEAGRDDFDEREAFNSLLEVTESLADAGTYYEIDGGPGRSSAYVDYFVRSGTNTQDLMARFNAASCE